MIKFFDDIIFGTGLRNFGRRLLCHSLYLFFIFLTIKIKFHYEKFGYFLQKQLGKMLKRKTDKNLFGALFVKVNTRNV
jgi:hypothetical protein